ncbi:rho-related protein racB [Rhipicephalus sanguineus]|nr:rho-related protein racB [Rhipicephalus sanguineus]
MTAIGKKLVIVGDGEGSERRPRNVFGDGELADVPVPAVLENYVATIDVRAELALWDTAGQEDYDRLRPLSHLKLGATLLCFSIDSPDFLYKPESWRPAVRHVCASVSVIFAKVMNPSNHLPMLADPAMTKHKHGVPEEKTTSVKTSAYGSPGVLRQDQGRRPQMSAIRKKLVIVGDVEVSETRSLSVCSDGELAEDSVTTVFENYVNTTEVRLGVALWDAAGQEDYDRLRPPWHRDRDVVLMCFSIDLRKFPDNSESGRREVRHFCLSVYVILAWMMNPRNFSLTLPDPAMTKQKHAAHHEGRALAEENNAYGSPGVLRQDQGWCVGDVR